MLWMKYGSRFFILLVHKFFKKISTHILTVLITGVIVRIEQKNKTTNTLFRKGEWAYEY